MRLLRRARNDAQAGYILLPVVLLITVIATIAFLINNDTAINGNITAGEIEAEKGQQVAQAGLAHAVWGAQNSGCAGDITMSTVPFGPGNYSATVVSTATTTVYSPFLPDRDTWIDGTNTAANHSGSITLRLKNNAGGGFRGLTHFDLSSITAGSRVATSALWLYVSDNDPDGVINIHPVTAAWTEADATWDSIGDSYDSQVFGTIAPQPAAGAWVSLNLTALTQSWVNDASTNHGLMLIAASNNELSTYTSKEYGTASLRPYLQVTTADSDVSPLTITATGTLTGNPSPANDITRTLARSSVTAYQPPSALTLQPDATGGKDVYIYQWKPTWNYGAHTDLAATHSAGSVEHSLLRFNLGTIAAGAKIISATLELYSNTSSWGSTTISLHRMNSDWTEGNSAGGTGAGATWTDRDSGTPWNVPGGDYEASPVASAVTPGGSGWVSWDVASLVDDWVSGRGPNYGLLLAPTVNFQGAEFNSSDAADPTTHPKLTITYACECGSPCLAPQGSGKVLLVVINPTTLVPADAKKKALFESWGYTVEVISESANQSEIDTAVSNNDVVYVSNTVNSMQLGGRLADVSIGVISEEGDYNPDFGTSSGAGWTSGSAVDVIDNSHYITALFPSGTLPIYAANMEGLIATGTMATDLQTLANWGSDPGLAVVETGGLLADGSSTAAGRRVMLPLGRSTTSGFNWDYLNANGRLIVQRTLQWGAGISALNGPLAHWKLDDAVGAIAVDSVGGHDGTLSGATWSSGIFDGALGFNAVSDYVDLGADPTLDNIFDSGATVMAWINPAGWGEGDFGRILDKADNLGGNRNGWAFEVYGSYQSLFFQHGFSGGIGNFRTPTGSISLNTWQHVAVVFDNSSDLNDPIIYIDGVVQTVTETSTPSGTRLSDSGITLTMGNYFIDFSRTFDGLLDDVRIYDSMLTEAEIADLAARPALTPLAHWKLDDGSGGIAVDSEGGHDGTLAGNPTWATGTLGDALDFDGAGDRIDVGPILDAGAQQISVMAWVFKRDTGDDRVISKSSGGAIVDHIFSLGVAGTTIRARLRTTDNGGTSNYDGGTISLDQWVHVAFTYDGGTLRIYKDGTETASYAVTGDMIASTLDVAIGNVNASDDRYWNGLLDDVRIYDRALDSVEIADLAAQGSALPPAFEEFTEAALGGNGSSLTISKPAGTASGDLLVAAVATDGNNASSLAPPAGWNVIHVADSNGNATFGVWWKLAGASESNSYTFSWSNNEQAYGWIMRFTGHDPASPIDVDSNGLGTSISPASPSVTTTVSNTLILRLGGFDDDDITAGAPGLSGHTAINMNRSGTGAASASGGSGYVLQAATGDSGASSFTLTKSEESVTVTIAIAPPP